MLKNAVGVVRYVWVHPANHHRRLRAVGRAIAFQIRGRLGHRTRTLIGGQQMWAVLHHTAAAKVVYGSPPDFDEMKAWRRLLNDGDLFVDVGSNVGAYALWAVDCGAEVIAIEAASSTAELLRENVALNPDALVEVLQCALADKAGELWLTEGLDATNHLVIDGSDGERVPVRTLDDVLGKRTAHGIKIDVEGAERLVLDGGSRALAEGRIRAIQLEWNSLSEDVLGEDRRPLFEILDRNGFRLFRPRSDGRMEPVVDPGYGADVFALRSM